MSLQAVQLSRFGSRILASPDCLDSLASTFRQNHFIYLPKLLEPELLQRVSARIQSGSFQLREHKGIGKELGMIDLGAEALLVFLFNNSSLFRFVERVTGCARVGSFMGRIYRYQPESDHFDQWHSDLVGDRMVALSLNLGREPHEGGDLEIRDKNTKQVLQRICNPCHGDAVLFQLDRNLEHRRTRVNRASKTAFAGWFKLTPDFSDLIRRKK